MILKRKKERKNPTTFYQVQLEQTYFNLTALSFGQKQKAEDSGVCAGPSGGDAEKEVRCWAPREPRPQSTSWQHRDFHTLLSVSSSSLFQTCTHSYTDWCFSVLEQQQQHTVSTVMGEGKRASSLAFPPFLSLFPSSIMPLFPPLLPTVSPAPRTTCSIRQKEQNEKDSHTLPYFLKEHLALALTSDAVTAARFRLRSHDLLLGFSAHVTWIRQGASGRCGLCVKSGHRQY